jgi:iron complex transport system permease protein
MSRVPEMDRRGGPAATAPAGRSDRGSTTAPSLPAPTSAAAPLPRLFLLAGILVVVAVLSLLLGAARIAPGRLFSALSHPGSADPSDRILLDVRLPRIVLGALAGAALALSGTLLQAFFQNPMAGPYVVGVSSGAGLAAVAAMTLGLTFRRGPFDLVAVAAFAGGIGSVALVYALARRIRFLQSEGLLLIGIAVGSVFSALTSVFLVFSREGIQAALMWMLGTFSGAEWTKAWALLGALLVGGAGSLWLGRDLNLLLWGDEVAQSLGCPVRAVRRGILLLSSLLAAASVAACGVVGFVGLMVPHLVRGTLRTADHRYVLPGAALLGAALTVAADTLARTVAAPLEIPVGAVTSALGAPFLVWLVVRRHRRVDG